MRSNFFHGWTVVAVVGEEFQDEVLEGGAERVTVDLVPVGVKAAVQQQSVEVLLLACFFKRKDALHDNKEDDS